MIKVQNSYCNESRERESRYKDLNKRLRCLKVDTEKIAYNDDFAPHGSSVQRLLLAISLHGESTNHESLLSYIISFTFSGPASNVLSSGEELNLGQLHGLLNSLSTGKPL